MATVERHSRLDSREDTMTNKEQIKEAGSMKNMLIWRSVYNNLCRQCQLKIFRAVTDIKAVGTQVVVDRMNEIINNHFCPNCKRRTSKILEGK